MEGVCVWCGRAFDERSPLLPHRILCSHCGVGTAHPWPTPTELDEAYSGWYRPESGRFSGIGDKIFSLLRGGFSRRLLAIAPEGPILDVGAGEGSLVDSLRAKGREAVGLDPYSHRDDLIKERIDEVQGEWAGIVFWHSLEHVPDPSHQLEEAARLLAPSGVIVIAIPNPSSIQAGVFKGRWLHLDHPRHLAHIPAEPLQQRLLELGLRVDRLSYYRGGNVVFGWLHGLVGSISSDLDLYDAIRKPEARSREMSSIKRIVTIALGVTLLPVAMVASAIEVALRRGGTIYVEGSKP